jgi:hypothetical protein
MGGARAGWVIVLSVATALGGCGDDSSSDSGADATAAASSPTTSDTSALSYVAFGDSWPEGAHCDGCTPFPELWADDLLTQTGVAIGFEDFTGDQEESTGDEEATATLLESLRNSEATRTAVQNADIILIATGPNEIGGAIEPLLAGTCGGPDQLDCVRALGQEWHRNFDAILTEIEALRRGQPTAIRLVNAAEPTAADLGEPADELLEMGLPHVYEQLTVAMCDGAAAHNAVCIDVRPLFTAAEENAPESMRAVTDALVETGLAELD